MAALRHFAAVTGLLAATAVSVTTTTVDAVSFPASAPAPAFTTRMEIDGNKTNGAAPGFDWQAIQSATPPGPYTGTNFNSTGIVDSTFQLDVNNAGGVCDGTDTTANPVSQFPDSNSSTVPPGGSNFNGWQIGPTGLQAKVDACSGAAALEIVELTAPAYDQLHFVLYQYWTRNPGGTGSIVFFTVLQGPLAGRCDDYLIKFDFNPAGGAGTFSTQRWVPTAGNCANPFGAGTWQDTGAATTAAISVAGPNVDPMDQGTAGAGPSTFAESAVDLTALGLLPEDQCVTYSAAGFFTQTGNNGQLEDFLQYSDPLQISSCNSLTVTKVGAPAGLSTTQPFTYRVNQNDGRTVHDGTLTGTGTDTDGTAASITSQIQLGQTHTWNGVLAEPDYLVGETALPPGWQLSTIVCTYRDLLGTGDGTATAGQPGFKTVTLSTGGASTGLNFDVYPSQFAPAPSCTITNTTAGIEIVKDAVPDNAQDFSFTGSGPIGTFVLDDDADPTLPASRQFLGLSPGTYTVSESATAGWSLTGLTCTDATGDTTTAGATATIALAAGELVSCRYTNTKLGSVTVVKDAQPDDPADFGFTGDLGAFSLDDDADATLPNTRTFPNLTPGTFSVTESTTPGWHLDNVTCSDPTGGTTTSGATASIAVDPGDDITCTYTNAVDTAQITLVKAWGAGPTGDAVSLSAAGSSGLFPAASGASTNGGASSAAVLTVRGGETVTLSEAFTTGTPANYTSTLDCGGAPISLTGLNGTYTVPATPVDVTCTFTNTRISSTLTLQKLWVNGANGDSAGLNATATNTAAATSTAPDAPGAGNSATLTGFAGETVNLDETLGAGNVGAYTSVLDCPGQATTTGTSGTYVVPAAATAATCTFTNSRISSTVVVRKAWVDGLDGDATDLAVSGPQGSDTATSTATGAASETDTTNSATITVLSGEPVDLSEMLAAGNGGSYASVLACDAGTLSANTGTAGTLTAPATAGTTTTCTFTNSRDHALVQVVKVLNDPVADSTFDLSINGSVVLAGTTGGTSTTVSVLVGDTVTVGEAAATGELANFASSLTCGNVALATNTGTAGSFVVPASAANTTVTCTFTNTRVSSTLTVQKVWVNGATGDTAALTADGTNSGAATSTAPEVPAAANTATIVVYAGETVGVAETLGAGNVGTYMSTLACATQAATAATSGTYTVPANPSPVTCTFTNTRVSSTIVVRKAWVDGRAGDTTGLAASGSQGSGTATSTATGAASETDTTNTVTIAALSGETINLSETLGASNLGSYTSVLGCVGGGTLATNTGTAGTLIAPATTATTTCTFTNTRQRALVQVVKVLNDPVGDSTFDLSINGTVALAGTTGGTSSTVDVLVGDTVTVGEAAATGSLANFASSLTCGNVTLATNTGTAGSFVVPASAANATVACTFTNTRRSSMLALQKVWINGATGDTAALSAAATDGATATSTAPDAPAAGNTATIDIYAGETVDLTETLGAANVGGYTSTLACGTQATTAGTAGTYAVPANPAPITCTFTNTRTTNTLVLRKAWALAAAGDTTALSATAAVDGGTATSTATGAASETDTTNIVTITALSGETVSLGETLGAANAGAYGTTLACDAGTVATTSPTAGTVRVPNTAGATTTCTFTNTAARGTIVVVKQVAGADSTFTFNGTWPLGSPFSFTTVGGTGQATFNGVLVGNYSVSELVPSGYALNGITCTDADGGSSTTATTGVIDLDANETVTCTFANAELGPLDVVKTVASGPTLVSGATYRVVYSLTVTSQSFRAETFDLSDTLAFGAGITPTVVSVGPPTGITPVAGWNGTTNTLLVDDGTIAARGTLTFTITVDATIAGTATTTVRDCRVDAGEQGSGFGNGAVVTWGGGSDDTSTCVPAPTPTLSITKSVSSAPVRNPDGTYTLAYDIVVGNTGQGPGSYTLTDTFAFAPGVVVTAVSSSNVVPGTIATNSGFNGAGDPVVATSTINAAVSHTYRITVTANVSGVHTISATDCTLDEGETGTGFLNRAQVNPTAEACAPIPPEADVAVTKVTTTPSITMEIGTAAPSVGWTITVVNNGPVEATGVTLDDTVPSEFGSVQASPSSGTCTVTGQALHCGFGTLANGATVTVNVTATIVTTVPGTYRNTAVVASTGPTDPNLTNNSSSADTDVAVLQATTTTAAPIPTTVPAPPTTPPTGLPITGGTPDRTGAVAILLGAIGAIAVVITRRRRSAVR